MNAPEINKSTTYGLLKTLEMNPDLSQRELSSRLGVSLGKVNFCLKSLVDKGCLKVNNFRDSNNKRAYAYLLTQQGMEVKAHMTIEFLKYKMEEYDRLRMEIEELEQEARVQGLLEQKDG